MLNVGFNIELVAAVELNVDEPLLMLLLLPVGLAYIRFCVELMMTWFPLLPSFENAFSRKSKLGGVTGVEHGTSGAVLPTNIDIFPKGIV